MSTPVEKFRTRVFVAVLYPEDPTHAECMKKLETNGYNYAAILHDKDLQNDEDETKKEHWHVVLRFKNAVYNTAIAKELGIGANYLESCRDQDAALLYLVHHDKPDKHQYELEEVFGPMRLKLATLLADTDEGTRALNICQIIEETPGLIGYTELLKKAVAAGLYADLRRMGQFAVGIMREHNNEIYEQLKYQEDRTACMDRQVDLMNRRDDIPFDIQLQILEKNGLLNLQEVE